MYVVFVIKNRNAKDNFIVKLLDANLVRQLRPDMVVPHDCQLRRVKFLNNVIEQDYRFIKKKVRECLNQSCQC